MALVAEGRRKWRIDKRIETRYLDEKYTDIDAAIDAALEYKKRRVARASVFLCNAVHLLQRLLERNIIPDTLTDQTGSSTRW